jgi:hypothetical protein
MRTPTETPGTPVDAEAIDSIKDLEPTDRVWVTYPSSGTASGRIGHLDSECSRCPDPSDVRAHELQNIPTVTQLCDYCIDDCRTHTDSWRSDQTSFEGSVQEQLQRAAEHAEAEDVSPLEAFSRTARRRDSE